ncbi:hypothetical protein HHK36_001786 [Tetracentron sinense]|uniref:Glutamate receptor n=1 Tax=Tetracentron sinense TaxID=13715 RepID=A0A835DSD5_TETSI|nr:hypothetical protein HHK36_001786 [Tetracentron sinense]
MPSSSHLLSFMVLLLLISSKSMADDREDPPPTSEHFNGRIGAIIDYNSRIGKEEKVAMEMAIQDFYNTTSHRPFLHFRDSKREPVRAALAAMELMDKKQVQAILGLGTWEEASLVADLGNRAHVPILTFAETAPPWASERWPFLVRASDGQYAQMRALAAIVASWEWRRVTVVYEDIDSAAMGVIPHLATVLREVGSEIDHLVALPPFASSSSSLSEELEKLKSRQCRVFIVHSSLPLAARLFTKANKMGMMAESYVWITTDTIASLLHSLDASTISSMQGVVGIRSYFPQTGARFREFYIRFRSKFLLEHPEEENLEPGIFALQAYDAVWAVALAMEETIKVKDTENSTYQLGHGVPIEGGQKLLEGILRSDFDGLTSKVYFREQQLAQTFQIVNVFGNSYRELGFWNEGEGFSGSSNKGGTPNASMRILGQVFWPGGPWFVPRGWALPTTAKPLRIGVPARPTFNQFVNVKYDHPRGNRSITGFSIDVFKATVEELPYHLPYEFFPYEGTYDSLVEQVHLKRLRLALQSLIYLAWFYAWEKIFDAVVGDTAIVAKRFQHAEFSHPYTEPGLVMVVPVKSKLSNRCWLFVKPFTKSMWALTAVINVYNGFVVWMIERNHFSELKGSETVRDQIGIMLWLSFTTLFSLHGERLHSNLSRMAMVVWLFVALVITQSYTASLTSMLTVQRLEPTVADVDSLRNSNAIIGCSGRSFVAKYLEDVFPKGSPLIPDISEAILKMSESGKLRELESNLIISNKCSNESSEDSQGSLSPQSFWVLFIITGGISTVSLVLFIFPLNLHLKDSIQSILVYKSMRGLILALIKHMGAERANPSEELTVESHRHRPPDVEG